MINDRQLCLIIWDYEKIINNSDNLYLMLEMGENIVNLRKMENYVKFPIILALEGLTSMGELERVNGGN